MRPTPCSGVVVLPVMEVQEADPCVALFDVVSLACEIGLKKSFSIDPEKYT